MAREDTLKFQITIGNDKIIFDLSKELAVSGDPNDIADRLKEHAATYAYYSIKSEEASLLEQKLQHEFDVWLAELYEATKTALLEQYGKSQVTERFINNKIMAEHKDEYQDKRMELLQASFRKRKLAVAQKAVDKHGISLVNLLSYHKKELEKLG